jgi:hypothetical protein
MTTQSVTSKTHTKEEFSGPLGTIEGCSCRKANCVIWLAEPLTSEQESALQAQHRLGF